VFLLNLVFSNGGASLGHRHPENSYRKMNKLPDNIATVVSAALNEDIGTGDVSAALVSQQNPASAQVMCRETAVICGTAWFEQSFFLIDKETQIQWHVNDGDLVSAGQTLCHIQGNARALLSAERTALNFLQTLSATATVTHKYVQAIAGTACKILDTRKTIPGLRSAQKYAVLCGGGCNHRMGLYDAILIKENHIVAAGSITAAMQKARQTSANLLLEVEIEQLEQIPEAIAAGAQRLLLDNMDPEQLRQAVAITHRLTNMTEHKVELEASGGVQLQQLRDLALTGVDYISVGAITKHIHAVDLSMRFDFS